LGDAHKYIGLQYQAALHTKPLVAAALDGIDLLSELGTFVTLSRWLRSPFFCSETHEQARAAAIEARLRNNMAAQLPFLVAYEQGGLRFQLERDAPEFAMKVAEALREARMGGPVNSPSQWARVWSRILQRLGWPGLATSADDPVLAAWDDALARFAQLTPILGSISFVAAMSELRMLIDTQPGSALLPRYGVHVFDHMDAVGPGYGAVWVTGLTDQQWPERGRPNPLLPHTLQRAHRMPWSTPQDAIGRAGASTARLLGRVEEVIFSWPASVHEYPAEPSPVIAGFTLIDAANLRTGSRRTTPTGLARAMEQVADAAPAYDRPDIEGGAHTLNLQARCPVRAFCESRLRAIALEPPVRGLTARAQGIAVHDALELFMRTHPSQESLPTDIGGAQAAIRRCVASALTKLFGPARTALRALYELECARIETLLAAWLQIEKHRPPFTAVKVEERTEIEIGGKTISNRIDRVDALPDGSLALIDYKTGKTVANVGAWFGDRLFETQLPL
jgi:probable DNA repair protein